MDFTLSTYFNAFDIDKEYELDVADIDSKLENVTNLLADNPEGINSNPELFEDLVELVHGFKQLESKHQKQIAYLLTSSFNGIGHLYGGILESGDYVDNLEFYRGTLERYGYLVFVLAKHLGKEEFTKSNGKFRSPEMALRWKSNCVEVEDCLTSIVSVLKMDLSKIFITSPERDSFIELFTRPIMNLMESPDRMKVTSIKLLIFKVIAIAVRNHGHATIIQHNIIQCLTYYIHLPIYMAELLHIVATQYDYLLLTEEVLREISQTQFNSNDTNGPKTVSEFLIRLSELSPRLILKQMSYIAQLLDNSNQSLRCSVVETCGNIVVDILKTKSDQEVDESANNGVEGLLDLLQDRVLDQNPYVRTKAFQALTKVLALNIRMSARRQKMIAIAVRSLDDRSTLVRRNCIKFMSKLILTHQFTAANGSRLAYSLWKKSLDEAEAELLKYLPLSPKKKKRQPISRAENNEEGKDNNNDNGLDPNDDDNSKEVNEDNDDERTEEVNQKGEEEAVEDVEDDEDEEEDFDDVDEDELQAAMEEQEHNLPDTTVLFRAKLKANYFKDAVDFIEAVQLGTEIVSKLLFSKNRNEAIDSMDFLVLADAYGVETSEEGIRRMLHLVWSKGSSDEGKSVPSHLIDCYTNLFLTAPKEISRLEQTIIISKNLIGLTLKASLADLASLEKLLGMMYDQGLINPDVVKVLWQVYSSGSLVDESQSKQRLGSIIILGMLASADNSVALKGLDALLSVGLGEVGRNDLALAKYTCIALQRLVPSAQSKSISKEDDFHEKLATVLLRYSEEPEWFAVAEQGIAALYQVSSRPETVCSELIKQKASAVFKESAESENKSIALSQLLFIVGHIAIKTIVHLEKLEGKFKKKKHDAESKKSNAKDDDDDDDGDELEMIGGTSEDDFTDAVNHVKEKELLFGEGSLLARFGPLVKEICANNHNYNNTILQRSAVLCMAKFMCVSSVYCEQNLPLLITIMEKSEDPIIRCNCVLALGDMAVCFNNIVDESTDFIYRRLTDDSMMVQRTCLMTITFLILAGQVKVKGQLSSMAKCLENADQGISDMCRLFFAELATKDNAIYNGFIDIFSGLSNDDSLTKDSMKRILKFLLSFIDKEKQQKQLSDKLLVRLSKCQTETQWNDVAFVLTTIPYKNEAITAALDEGFKLVSARN